MKTVLIWLCGTGTPAAAAEHLFEGQYYDEKHLISGVGTKENVLKAKENGVKDLMGANANAGITTKISAMVDYVAATLYAPIVATKDIVLGYREHHQISQLFQIAEVIEGLAKYDDNEVHLIIGGHSRGIADGMLGFLTSLYLHCTQRPNPDQHLFFKKANRVSLIAVDPVNGAELQDMIGGMVDRNDIMGFDELPWDQRKISHLLHTMERATGKPGLFDVVLYTARFDARDEFLLDKYWLEFLEDIKRGVGYTGTFKYYVGGFRHSAMVSKNDELTELYVNEENDDSPVVLLRHILMDVKGNTTSADLAYSNLAAKEMALMDELVNQGQPVLQGKTHTKSYSWAEMLTSYGKPLETILAENKDVANPLVNNRYLKHQ